MSLSPNICNQIYEKVRWKALKLSISSKDCYFAKIKAACESQSLTDNVGKRNLLFGR